MFRRRGVGGDGRFNGEFHGSWLAPLSGTMPSIRERLAALAAASGQSSRNLQRATPATPAAVPSNTEAHAPSSAEENVLSNTSADVPGSTKVNVPANTSTDDRSHDASKPMTPSRKWLEDNVGADWGTVQPARPKILACRILIQTS